LPQFFCLSLAQQTLRPSAAPFSVRSPIPAEPPSLALIPPRPAGTRAVEPSTIDWCAGLVLSGDGTVKAFDDGWYETLKKYSGWFPSIPLYTAQLEVITDNQYTLTTTQLASQHFDLTPTCLVAQGVVLDKDISQACADLGEQMQKFVSTRLNALMGLKATVYGNKDPASLSQDLPLCLGTTDGGCSCDYNVSLTTTTAGPWVSNNSGQTTFFDAQAAPPSQTDFCLNGENLHLSGTKDTDLFNRTSLKTLTLRAPSCTDGVQSKTLGEEGVDCGGTCSPCPSP